MSNGAVTQPLSYSNPIEKLSYYFCDVAHTYTGLFLFKVRRSSGKTPYYFPEKFGKLIGVKNRPKDSEQEFMLTYEVDEVMTSMVTLQISADDIILIYNRFVSTRNIMFQEALNAYSGKRRLDVLRLRQVQL